MSFGPIMRFSVGKLRIELAPLTKEVMSEFVSPGMQYASITRYLAQHTAPVLEDELEWFDKVRAQLDRLLWGIWVIEGDKRTLIGNSALEDINIGHGKMHQATSGSMIFRKEYWGQGIASAAHKARTLYAFHELGLHRIMSAVVQGNEGSLKALTRSGYNLVYIERNTVFADGKIRHQYNLECLNPLEPFWSQWWNGEKPTAEALQARRLVKKALAWAEAHVELL